MADLQTHRTDGLFDVAGKVALVTGGGSGIGFMIAQCLSTSGARVYICGRNAQKLERAATSLDASAITADIATAEGVEIVRAAVNAGENHLDLLINNAGTSWVAAVETFPEGGWDKVLALNTKAPLFLVKTLLPLLSRTDGSNGWASVVMITSARASTAQASSIAYKCFESCVESHDASSGGQPRRPSYPRECDSTGLVRTNLNKQVVRSKGNDLLHQQTIKRSGSKDDLAGAILFLCSRAGSYVNGHILASWLASAVVV